MFGNKHHLAIPLSILAFLMAAPPAAHGADTPEPAPPLVSEQPAAVVPPLSASSDPDRTFIDIPLAAGPAVTAGATPAAVSVEFSPAVPADAVRSVTIYLRSEGGWLSAQLPTERARGTVRISLGAFTPEGSAGPAAKADTVRVSLWRRAPDSDTPPITIPFVGFTPPADIVVVRATDATAPGESDFAAQMAAQLERLLTRAGIPFDTLPDTDLALLDRGSGATPPSFVLLPYAPALSTRHIAALRAHVSAGGRILAFYNRSPELSALLGLAPPQYRHDIHGWTAMNWRGRRIPHHTSNLLVPTPDPKAPAPTILATWVDSKDADTRLPAIAVTRHGALFAHIPPLAFPSAQDLLVSLLASTSAPAPTDSEPAPSESAPVDNPPLPDFAIVGAWVPARHLPASIPPALNTLYAYLAAAPAPKSATAGAAGGKAPRPSQSTKTSPAIHIWLPLLHPVDRPDARWLDPSNPEDRAAALRRIRAAALRHPAGIHFDYLRSTGGTPASPKATAAVTALLREAADIVHDIDSAIVLSAAVFPTPASAADHNQDWPAWLREGLLEYVVPMLYADDPASFHAMLDQCLAVAAPDRLVAGIGTGADEAQVDAAAFRAEVEAAAAAHLRGIAFFPLDDALRELLPKKKK